jgi:hypothetical protein
MRKSTATAITATRTSGTNTEHPRFNRAGGPSGDVPAMRPQGRDDVHLRGQGLMNRATFGDVQ